MDFKIFPVLLIALVVLVSGCIQETEIDKDKLKDLLGETIDDVSFDQTALKDKEGKQGSLVVMNPKTGAILALCNAAAERFKGESNAVEAIQRMRDERIEQICQSGA